MDPVPIDSLRDRDAVTSAGEAVVVDGATLTLSASAWTNDMPGADSVGLLVSTTVTSSASTLGLGLAGLFVVRGSEVWAPGFSNESRPTLPANQAEGVARSGPAWRAPDKVDIVVRLAGANGASVYVAKRGVEIISAQ